MLKLPCVTLVAMTSVNVPATIKALLYSTKQIEFGRTLLISHEKPAKLPQKINFAFTKGIINNIDKWCYEIIYELHKYIYTDYALLIHSDGFVVNPSKWNNQFLKYDYIGAPFPLPQDSYSYRDLYGNIIRVGNSVSLRSRKILKLPTDLNLRWERHHGYFHEDGFLCCKNKHILEKNGIKFAPIEVAKNFSHEAMIPEIKRIKPFAFHKWEGSNKFYPNFESKNPIRKLINSILLKI